jgi:signal transduction histidine kinase/CheY-like chemotaxis protein
MRDLADLHDRLRKAFGTSVPDDPQAVASPAEGLPAAPLAFLQVNELMQVAAVIRLADGTICGANPTFQTMTGCRAPEGCTLEELGLPVPAEPGLPREVEFALRDGIGIYAWQDVVVRAADPAELLVLSALRDVTAERRLAHEREDARMQAEEASSLKSRQLATVVHELRTPLNGILGMSQLLQQSGLTPEQTNYVGAIREAGSALAQLVDDLLDYSTIEAGRFRLNSRAENLRQLLESVVEMLAPRAHEKRIEIGATVSSDVPNLMDFDPARLRQVLFNVIGNAVKFTRAGGVLIRVALEAADIVITVSDTGPGMTTEEQQRIFGEFEQAGSAGQRSGGAGLGLSISARILKEFGGSLSVTSEQGRGTTFAIRFPALSADGPKEGSDRMLVLRSSRVLLLAPAGSAADATIATVETLGGRCRHVRTAQEASLAIETLARQGVSFTDMVVDHRLADAAHIAGDGLRRILLVSPEERGTQSWDAYDAWLIRPLREQSLVDVLRGRLGGFGSQRSGEIRPQAVAASAPAQPTRWETGLSVLLAEDDPVSALMVGAMLRKAGFLVHHVPDLAALRQALAHEAAPDLVISDIHMPDGDLAELLPLEGIDGKLLKTVPLLVLSGETDHELVARMLDGGALCVLQKPLDPQRLLAEIRAVLPTSPQHRRVS